MITKIDAALGLFTCLLSFSSAIAQGPTTGRIEGVVRDQSGAVIVGVRVDVLRVSTGDERTATTDTEGRYSVPLLTPGIYRATFAARGFATAVNDVQVAITETTQLDVKLDLSAVDTAVVTVAAPVQKQGPQLGRIVDVRTISELPLATRNFTQILSLSPGVSTYLPDSTAVGRNTQTISVNGARVTQNNIQINGIDANTMGTSSAINIAVPAPETIQEFKVQTSLYDASFGRGGGGNVQLVTRSGSNEFHGAAYEYARDDILNANNPFLKAAGVRRPVLKRNIYGVTLGGPFVKDRAFFFGSYQGTRETNGASILNSISSGVLTAAGLTNDRSEQRLLEVFKPTLASGLKATAIDSVALALLNAKLPSGQFLIPTPQASGRYFGSALSRFRENQLNANFDYRPGKQNWLAVKLFLAYGPSQLALPSFRGTGPNLPGFGTDQKSDVTVLAIQDVQVLNAKTLNEARVGYNVHRNSISPLEPLRDSDFGISRTNANRFPGLGLIRVAQAAGGMIIGTATNLNSAKPSVMTFSDTLSRTQGRHYLRTGAEVRYNRVDLEQSNFARGQIDFSNFNNFLVGTSTASVLGSGIGDRQQRATDYNFFLQDDWQVASSLTFNLGLRYELDLPPYERRGLIATFDPALYAPRVGPDGLPVGPPLGGFVQAGNVITQFDLSAVPNVGKRVVRSIDPNNFAPRIGFAYSPLASGRVALRAGYGISYSRATFQYVSTSVTTPPTYLLGRTSAPQSFADPFFHVPSQDQFPTFVSDVALAGTVLDRAIRTPYIHQYNGSIEYEVIKDWLFEIAYVGTRGTNLFRQLAINQARLASPQHPVNEVTGQKITTNTPQNASRRAPFQGVETSSFFQNQTTAQSSYNSLQVSLSKRLSHGLQALGSYAFAKSIDNASGTGGAAGTVGLVNPGAVGDTSNVLGNQNNNRANRGISDFDRRHRFVLSFLWELPQPAFAKRSSAKRLIFDGWQASGIVVAMSGLPIDIVDTGAGSFYGLANGSTPLARPNWTAGVTGTSAFANVPSGYFFNPFAFSRPLVQAGHLIPTSGGLAVAGASGTDIGDVGRNVLRGPSQTNVDLSISKRFGIDESKTFELRAEVFNLFNHVNLANPISDFNAILASGGSIAADTGRVINPGAFGRIISTSNNPRLIQVALKFNF